MLRNIHKLRPTFVYKIWGGVKLESKLKESQSLSASNNPLGETWEVSIHPDGPCFLEDGSMLSEHVNQKQLPYLIKFIDTSENLSVQVHPNDDYAKRVEKGSGKTECWIITEAQAGAGIYLGFKKGINPSDFKDAVLKSEDLTAFLQYHEVSPGDFFYVPAGSVHAIGEGVTLLEVQQSSGITYRVWDWNRVDKDGKGRELHIDKAMDVLNFDENANTLEFFKAKKELFKMRGCESIIEHRDFNVDLHNINSGEKSCIKNSGKYLTSLVCLKGELTIKVENEEKTLKAYESMIINDTIKDIEILASGSSSYVVVN